MTKHLAAKDRHLSPLRYPGGKARLAPVIQAVFEANRLLDGHYAEPYAGGAGIALALVFREYASHVHINDADRSIFAFWHSALRETEALCKRISDTRVSMSQWHREREVQQRKYSSSPVDLGFSTFFLNRTNRSGIIASGGVIGGNRQLGAWSIDARYEKRALIRRIQRIAAYGNRISIYNLDAEDFLGEMAGTLPERSLVYLDPPYYHKGTQRLYANYYRPDDHARLSTILPACPWPWIVSYDAVPEIARLYRHLPLSLRYDIRYSASTASIGREAMFFSPDLLPPQSGVRAGFRQRWLGRSAA
jgi:DNA adenine methylase